MKCQRKQPNQSAAAIVTVLVLISAISFIVVSLISVERNEVRTTNYRAKSVEARLVANAGFRDACNLLTHLLKEEEGRQGTVPQTLVSSVIEEDDGGVPTRYTFISKIEQGVVNHYPLFTGGEIQTQELPDLSQLVCGDDSPTDLLLKSPLNPKVEFADSVSSYVKTFGLTHLGADGNLIAETTAPLVGREIITDDNDSRFEQRYSFWIEDLEGYPNLDAVGGNLNEQGDFEYTLAANSPDDRRVKRFDPLPANDETGVIFVENLKGQGRVGLPAPGLSPQEIFLHPWELSAGADHPYLNIDKLLAARGDSLVAGSHLSLAPDVENRFVKGLKPYYEVPRVPYNHGYHPDYIGRPKLQINKFLNEKERFEEVRNYFIKNLPEFGTRKGGFPEDYVGTLLANMIDYADEDSSPEVKKTDVSSLYKLNSKTDGDILEQNFDYRGVDSYLPINEFFYRIEVLGKSEESVSFAITLFAEFWNPFQSEVEMNNVTANFWFVEPFQFKAGLGVYNFNSRTPSWKTPGQEKADFPSVNEPRDNPKSFKVLPNSYYVHNFGDLKWSFSLEADTQIESIGSPSRSGQKDGKAQVQLLVDGLLVDQSGRPFHVNSNNQEVVGFNIPRFRDSNNSSYTRLHTRNGGIGSGDFMMVNFRPCNERRIGGNGTFWGDPFMTYYGAGHAEDVIYKKSSPGSRNHYVPSSARSSEPFKAETRVRDWPDRGYDEPTGGKPRNISDSLPGASKYAATSKRSAAAPFRISNRGKYFSIVELGNLHDPVMWMIRPAGVSSSQFARQSRLSQTYNNFGGAGNRDNPLWFYPKSGDMEFVAVGDDVFTSKMFGGGNTLRVCRKEHPLFDEAGMRASQLLDLFQVGEPGTDLIFEDEPQDYSQYDSKFHYPPQAADTSADAASEPYSKVYSPYAHSQGDFRRIFGHLNINTIPTAIEMECLLRHPFTMNELVAPLDRNQSKLINGRLNLQDGSSDDYSALENGLKEESIPIIARDLMRARPFASSSHLARVLSELIHKHEALPVFPNDAIAEEPVARVLNLTHLTSRHFRIFVQGEVVPKQPEGLPDVEPVSQSTWVYEVYLNQERDSVSGAPGQLRCEILSSREL